MSRDARRPVADQDLPDVRPQSIGTDQRTPFDTAPIFELNGYTVIAIREASYLCGDRELDFWFGIAGIDKCVVQIGSVRDSLRIRKRFGEAGIVQRYTGHDFTVESVPHD